MRTAVGLACDDWNNRPNMAISIFSHCGSTLFCDAVLRALQYGCVSKGCPGDLWSVLPLPVQQLIPVVAPLFPGMEESGACLGCLFMFQVAGKIRCKSKK